MKIFKRRYLFAKATAGVVFFQKQLFIETKFQNFKILGSLFVFIQLHVTFDFTFPIARAYIRFRKIKIDVQRKREWKQDSEDSYLLNNRILE